MAIVILIFAIQTSTAFEEDNDFNLIQTNDDIDTVTVQVEDDIIVENTTDVINTSTEIETVNQNVLSASNDNDVLGAPEEWHVSDNSLNNFLTKFRSISEDTNIFLDGRTISGASSLNGFPSGNCAINIYGGTSITDTTMGTIDLSKFTGSVSLFRFQGDTIIKGVNFINYDGSYAAASEYSLIQIGIQGSNVLNSNIDNCNFLNITTNKKNRILTYILAGSIFPTSNPTGNYMLSNCNFTNCTASQIVFISSNAGKYPSFKAYNNTFINNSGLHDSILDTSNSLGLCFKINSNIRDSIFDNNKFINNTGALHGAAYCVLGQRITISNNYIEGNQAKYGAGIEAHLGTVYVYHSIFVNNRAEGNNTYADNAYRNGSGAAIAFVGGNNYVENCTFINNSAERYAGAVDIIGANVQIVDSKFYNNTAQLFAGAAHIKGLNAEFDNCIFNNNNATVGGAIYIEGDYSKVIQSNFTDNNAIQGAATYIDGFKATISNSNFTDNNATHNLGYLKDDS